MFNVKIGEHDQIMTRSTSYPASFIIFEVGTDLGHTTINLFLFVNDSGWV